MVASDGEGGERARAEIGMGYTARDVFSQDLLPSNASGFVVNVTGWNSTLVLIQAV